MGLRPELSSSARQLVSQLPPYSLTVNRATVSQLPGSQVPKGMCKVIKGFAPSETRKAAWILRRQRDALTKTTRKQILQLNCFNMPTNNTVSQSSALGRSGVTKIEN